MPALLWITTALALGAWGMLLRRIPPDRGVPPEWRAGEYILAGLFGAYFFSSILAGGGPEPTITPELIRGGITFYALLLGTLLTVLAVRGLSPGRIFGLRPVRPWRVIGLALVCFAATYPLVLAASQIVTSLGFPVSEGDNMVNFLLGDVTPTDRIWVVVLAVVVAPLTEEFVFRGFLYGVLKKPFGSWAAMGSTALLFAAIHQNIPAIPALALLAIGFTLAYELTGSLWAPIIMHVLFNSISVVVLFFFPEWANNL